MTTAQSSGTEKPSFEDAAARQRLARWQAITLMTLLVGYAGYYVCRSNFSVLASPIGSEFGLDKAQLGSIASWGVFFYALGKLFGGIACDFVGGTRVFLFGMVASVACTLLFVVGPGLVELASAPFVLTLAWSLNRLVQSPGWSALVKVSSRWFPVERHGRVMGILCLSYLFGDSLARLFLGQLLAMGLSWQGVYWVAAATLGAIALVGFFLLKPSPKAVDAPEPHVNPQNVYGARGEEVRPQSPIDLLAPFVLSKTFWLVCVMSVGLTLIREALNFWIPTYLVEVMQLSTQSAARWSALFPFLGGISALLAGHLTDRYAASGRGRVMLPALLVLSGALLTLSMLPASGSLTTAIVCLAGVFFALMGPYTFLTGVMALDFGGKRGSSTAAGLVDSAGYLGSMVSLRYMGSLADSRGWGAAFFALAIVAVCSAGAALLYWLLDSMRRHGQHRLTLAMELSPRAVNFEGETSSRTAPD